MSTADELIHNVVTYSQIPSSRRRREIQRELTAHIEDFIDAARDAGHEEQEIESLLMAHFGDARQVAEGFSHVYRGERRTFLVFAYALSALLIASSLLIAILAIQTSLAFGFGTSISELFASKHTVVQALDIVAFVAVYLGLTSLEALFVRYRFQKAAILLAAIGAVLTLSFRCMGYHPSVSFLWTHYWRLLSGGAAVCFSGSRAGWYRTGLFRFRRIWFCPATFASFIG